MAVESNIVFRIGSALGPGGFASLQAGIQLLGAMSGKVIQVAADAEKFAQVNRRLAIDITKADVATKGLIDTMALMESANKINNAQIKITEDQMKDLAVVATKQAQAVGEDATQAFQKLTDMLIRGRIRGLREYGIEMKEVSDLTKAHEQILAEVSKRAQGVNVEFETMTERIFALNNNIGTFEGLIWQAVSASDAFGGTLDSVNMFLGDINAQLAETPNMMGDLIFSMEGLKGMMQELQVQAVDTFGTIFQGLMDVLGAGELFEKGIKGLRDRQTASLDKFREEMFLRGQLERMQRNEMQEEQAAARELAAKARSEALEKGGRGGGGLEVCSGPAVRDR